jgi:hypothetical protein
MGKAYKIGGEEPKQNVKVNVIAKKPVTKSQEEASGEKAD